MSEYRHRIGSQEVSVDKIGGGTLGKAYEGDWLVTVMDVTDVLHTGTPKTHAQVARLAYEFASERTTMSYLSLKDHVSANREEAATEALVSVLGNAEAQQAVYEGQLPEFVEDINT